MLTSRLITELIPQRYSVRRYQNAALAIETQIELRDRLGAIRRGPLGAPVRFQLAAASAGDAQALRGLGAYGFVHHPSGFIIGAAQVNGGAAATEEAIARSGALEDYGYALEQAILEATDLGLGTCWLGGSFTQSSFGKRIDKAAGEIVPAVCSVGYAEAGGRARDLIRRQAHADQRLPWESLFFDGEFGRALRAEAAGKYAEALEMTRLAPSASNKQPWRVVRMGSQWHFYCQRTAGYGKGSLIFVLLNLADLQRLDIGIAMCHFELTARERGLSGRWRRSDPGLPPVDRHTVYIATWQGESE